MHPSVARRVLPATDERPVDRQGAKPCAERIPRRGSVYRLCPGPCVYPLPERRQDVPGRLGERGAHHAQITPEFFYKEHFEISDKAIGNKVYLAPLTDRETVVPQLADLAFGYWSNTGATTSSHGIVARSRWNTILKISMVLLFWASPSIRFSGHIWNKTGSRKTTTPGGLKRSPMHFTNVCCRWAGSG